MKGAFRNFQYLVILTGMVLAAAITGNAFAQDGEDAEEDDGQFLEEVLVTGIRQSLEAAADVKRQSATFVDSIIAEDIGKLADENVAEALSRVTGVQVRRSSAGEGDQVDIRGTALNRISINGRTLPAFQGRNANRSDRDNGGVSILGIIPSELVRRLDVTKLPTADQVEGSIGGNVDIVTRRPLDSEGSQLSISAQTIYADLADDFGQKGTFFASNTFESDGLGRLGASLGATYNKRYVREDRFFSFAGYQNRSEAFGEVNGRPVFGIAGLRYQQLESERETISANGAFQWEPNDRVGFYADVLYSSTDVNERRSWTQMNLPGDPSDYSDYTVSDNGTLVAGTFQNKFRGNTNHNPENEFDAVSMAFGGEFEVSDRLLVSGEFSFSKSELDTKQIFVLNRTLDNFDATFDFRAGDIPSLEISQADGSSALLTDIESYEFITYFNIINKRNAEDSALRLDVDYELNAGVLKSVEFGVRSQTLEQESLTADEFAFPQIDDGSGNAIRPPLDDETYAPFGLLETRDDLLSGVDVTFPRAGVVGNPTAFGLTPCASGIFDNAISPCTGPVLNDLSIFDIEEDTLAGYVKGNFEGQVGAFPFSAQAGVRVVKTDLTVNGFQRVEREAGLVTEPSSVGNEYTDVLPSGAIKFELTEEWVLRLGAAQVIRRPEPSSLNTGFSVVLLGGIGGRTENTGGGGNPFLKPFEALAVDASLEWYDDSGSVVTLGAFHKDVESFVTSVTELRSDIPGFVGTDILFDSPVNGDGAVITGVEIAAQVPFTFLPAPFDGFGIQANYSYIDSSIDSGGTLDSTDVRTGETLPFPGISESSYNIIGYYEKGPVSARLAYNWRDTFLDSIRNGTGVYFDSFGSVNASLRYAISENFSIDIEGTNLNQPAQESYAGFKDSLVSYAITDRRIFAGIRYRF